MAKDKENCSRSEQLGRSIALEQEHWKQLHQFGGSDPFWEDGVNLNLTRSHIIAYRIQCQNELDPEEYPEEYHMPVPPTMDRHYIARPDEIREHAKLSLKAYLEDENFQYLKKNIGKLKDGQIKDTCISNVIGYATGLASSISRDSLVEMRRHEHPERYLDSFLECRKKVEAILGAEKILPVGQLSMFDLYDM